MATTAKPAEPSAAPRQIVINDRSERHVVKPYVSDELVRFYTLAGAPRALPAGGFPSLAAAPLAANQPVAAARGAQPRRAGTDLRTVSRALLVLATPEG